MNPGDPVNILMVDDNPANLAAFETVLQNPDYNVVKTGSGREALRRLAQDEFAVALLDVSMPEMDGFALAGVMRQRDSTKHTPIILVTGISSAEMDQRRGYALGAVDYMLKPVAPEVLKAKVSVFVDLFRQRRELTRLNRQLAETLEGQAQFKSELSAAAEHKRAEESLKRIEWMLTKPAPEALWSGLQPAAQAYGDLTTLNRSRVILNAVGRELLTDIVRDFMSVTGTSSAVYEKNGDYALGMFASGWCKFMDLASRRLCGTPDNREALSCGRWLCHESCWGKAARKSIETGEPADIECAGGIRVYAVPIRAGNEVVGSINYGYGDPPRDPARLQDLARKFGVSVEELREHTAAYETRPPFLVEMAKNRLSVAARLVGEIIERTTLHESAERQRRQLEEAVEARTRELHLLQDRLVKRERLAALGQLAGSIAHEIRNPLGVIRSSAFYLSVASKGKLSGRLERHLAIIDGQVVLAEAIIRSLLDFAQGRPAERHPCRLAEIVDRAVVRAKLATGVKLKVSIPAELPDINVDAGQIEHVFLNLLTNSVQAMEDTGRVNISAEANAGKVRITVADSGPGIAAGNVSRVFEPLFSTKTVGVGLGLPLSRSYVEANLGTLEVESRPGEGATFIITLPVDDEPITVSES